MRIEENESIPLTDSGRMPSVLNHPRMYEPLPVRLVTIEDAHLLSAAGLERELDGFYVDLLGFEREAVEAGLVYHADNFRLIFDVLEPPIVRDNLQLLGIEVLSLSETEQKLIDAELQYTRQKGLNPGQESLVLRDPAGNWIELTSTTQFR